MIFSKPIESITYEDVKNYIAQNERESVNLDYKEDFPGNLEKAICAFANTYGGVVLIGVKDLDGYPVSTSEGIDFKDGFVERITQISTANIFPPLVPEVQVATNDGKSFVIVRVPHGKEAPYTVKHKYPYVRTGSVSMPEDLATYERLEWLRKQREQMLKLRENILHEMWQRCTNVEKIHGVKIPFGAVSMEIGPLFPDGELVRPKELSDLLEKSIKNGYGASFPVRSSAPRSVKNGLVVSNFQENTQDFDYCEINSYGFVAFKKDLGLQEVAVDEKGNKNVSKQRFYLSRLLFYTDLFLNFSKSLYECVNYSGLLRYSLVIDGMYKIPVCHYNSERRAFSNGFNRSFDNVLRWDLEMPMSILKDNQALYKNLLDFNEDIAFSFGYQHERGFIENVLKSSPYYPKEVAAN